MGDHKPGAAAESDVPLAWVTALTSAGSERLLNLSIIGTLTLNKALGV
jgi:hypothetical protein